MFLHCFENLNAENPFFEGRLVYQVGGKKRSEVPSGETPSDDVSETDYIASGGLTGTDLETISGLRSGAHPGKVQKATSPEADTDAQAEANKDAEKKSSEADAEAERDKVEALKQAKVEAAKSSKRGRGVVKKGVESLRTRRIEIDKKLLPLLGFEIVKGGKNKEIKNKSPEQKANYQRYREEWRKFFKQEGKDRTSYVDVTEFHEIFVKKLENSGVAEESVGLISEKTAQKEFKVDFNRKIKRLEGKIRLLEEYHADMEEDKLSGGAMEAVFGKIHDYYEGRINKLTREIEADAARLAAISSETGFLEGGQLLVQIQQRLEGLADYGHTTFWAEVGTGLTTKKGLSDSWDFFKAYTEGVGKGAIAMIDPRTYKQLALMLGDATASLVYHDNNWEKVQGMIKQAGDAWEQANSEGKAHMLGQFMGSIVGAKGAGMVLKAGRVKMLAGVEGTKLGFDVSKATAKLAGSATSSFSGPLKALTRFSTLKLAKISGPKARQIASQISKQIERMKVSLPEAISAPMRKDLTALYVELGKNVVPFRGTFNRMTELFEGIRAGGGTWAGKVLEMGRKVVSPVASTIRSSFTKVNQGIIKIRGRLASLTNKELRSVLADIKDVERVIKLGKKVKDVKPLNTRKMQRAVKIAQKTVPKLYDEIGNALKAKDLTASMRARLTQLRAALGGLKNKIVSKPKSVVEQGRQVVSPVAKQTAEAVASTIRSSFTKVNNGIIKIRGRLASTTNKELGKVLSDIKNAEKVIKFGKKAKAFDSLYTKGMKRAIKTAQKNVPGFYDEISKALKAKDLIAPVRVRLTQLKEAAGRLNNYLKEFEGQNISTSVTAPIIEGFAG